MSHGFTEVDAGTLVACIDMASLAALPLVVLSSRFLEMQDMLVWSSGWLLSCTTILLALIWVWGDHASYAAIGEQDSTPGSGEVTDGAMWWLPRFALVGTACGSTIAPVLLLALVPGRGASHRSTSRAYGEIEMFFVGGQLLITLLMGVTRQYYGFHGALWQVFVNLAIGTALALTIRMHDKKMQTPLLIGGVQRGQSKT